LFRIPLHDRFLVQDGHDFYAHHRRLGYLHPIAQEYGIGRDGHNFMRYTDDMTPVDADGRMERGGGKHDADYVGWNAPVYAAASGLIVAEHGAAPDNDVSGKNDFDPRTLVKNPLSFWGNYVVIDHSHHEFDNALGIAHKKGKLILPAARAILAKDSLVGRRARRLRLG